MLSSSPGERSLQQEAGAKASCRSLLGPLTRDPLVGAVAWLVLVALLLDGAGLVAIVFSQSPACNCTQHLGAACGRLDLAALFSSGGSADARRLPPLIQKLPVSSVSDRLPGTFRAPSG